MTIEVTGRGKNLQVRAPKSIKGGLVELELKNSTDTPRDGQIVRIEGDHSPSEFVKVVDREGGPIPDWIQDGGGVAGTDPAQTGTAVQNLAPGRYFVASEGDGPQSETATGELQVWKGTDGTLPKANAEITASEYTFDIEGLKAGKQKVLFRNAGAQLHHAVGAPLKPGRTIDDVKRFAQEMGGRPSGSPPIDEQAGFNTAVIDGGIEQVIDLNLKKPGKYAVMCFIQDRKGGPPHVMKGMIKEVDVR